MSKTLSFTNQKGGVGKTTSAVNVALSLAVSEVKTLLIDLDPQSNASTGLSDLIKEKRGNVYDVILRSESINDVVTSTSFDHLDIIISTNDLVGAEIELVGVMAREYQLQKAHCFPDNRASTVITLSYLRKQFPVTSFVWVMGADNLVQFVSASLFLTSLPKDNL